MTVNVNGNKRELPDGATVAELLDALGVDAERVVVELNGTIPDRSAYGATTLSENDAVEVVRFVGGG